MWKFGCALQNVNLEVHPTKFKGFYLCTLNYNVTWKYNNCLCGSFCHLTAQ